MIKHRWIILPAICLFLLLALGCDKNYDKIDDYQATFTRLHTSQSFFKDEHGRYVFLHGVNLSGSTKVPTTGDNFLASGEIRSPEEMANEPISYVGKPFSLEDADHQFSIIKNMGFNALRLLVIWEAIEHEGIGIYDDDYLDYLEKIVAKANEYGIYVLMDMHQDLFSRHLRKYFNSNAEVDGFTDFAGMAAAMSPPLNNVIRGDGAPKWVIQKCLPDKNLDSPEWGLPANMVSDPRNTSDLIPFTNWGINLFISYDASRCYATFFSGRILYPNYKINGKNIQDYLQDAYTNAWVQVAKRVKDYPNVIGYDVMNEPLGVYFILVLYSLLYREASSMPNGELTETQAISILDTVLNDMQNNGYSLDLLEATREFLVQQKKLPLKPSDFTALGFPLPGSSDSPYKPDVGAALTINFNFNRYFLQPLFEKVGKAIQKTDPNAVIFIEEAIGLEQLIPIGTFSQPMLKPEGVNYIVYEPHYYADIYAFPGINVPPRSFTVDEVRFRDYTSDIQNAINAGEYSLGNPPVVMGEFGTYFNFGGIEKSIEQNYAVSANILDNYYEDYEKLLLHNMIWCYSPENTKKYGDGWNKEDFSVLGPDGRPRAITSYSRPYPRYSSGRPTAMHFYSDYHYYEPVPGQPTPYREFYFEFSSKESDAPTEIFIPPIQYDDGFYVYISDGRCFYDPNDYVLYFYPDIDDPEATHNIKIRPSYANYGDDNWDYFFKGDQVLENIK